MARPTLTALMGETETGDAEPRLVLRWAAGDISISRVMSAAHRVAANVIDTWPDCGSRWRVVINEPRRTHSTTEIAIIGKTLSGSFGEAAEAITSFEVVAERALQLRREFEEWDGFLCDIWRWR